MTLIFSKAGIPIRRCLQKFQLDDLIGFNARYQTVNIVGIGNYGLVSSEFRNVNIVESLNTLKATGMKVFQEFGDNIESTQELDDDCQILKLIYLDA